MDGHPRSRVGHQGSGPGLPEPIRPAGVWNGTDPQRNGAPPMKGILLWLIGIPIPIIILLYIFNVF